MKIQHTTNDIDQVETGERERERESEATTEKIDEITFVNTFVSVIWHSIRTSTDADRAQTYSQSAANTNHFSLWAQKPERQRRTNENKIEKH